MIKKIAPLFTILFLMVIFFLSFLSVSADRGNQERLFSSTLTPNVQQAQLVPLLPNSQTLAIAQTGALSEVVKLRTITSKHYQLGPNLYQAEISPFPIHYKDANGNWQEIDTQPVARLEGGFEVEASNVKMIFPDQLQTGLVVNATIYPASQVDQKQLVVSSQVKPDPATLFKDSPTIGKATQNPPLMLPLQWQPQHLAYANDLGSTDPFFQFAGMSVRAVEKGVEYFQGLDNITAAFQPTAIGFIQRLQFAALSNGASSAFAQGMTKLEYTVHVKLSSDIQFYSRGVQQTGNFSTDVLELRDKAGNTLMIAPAFQLRDQTTTRTSPRVHYRVERLADGIALIAELPLDWLTDPNRKYPVTAESFVVIQSVSTNSFSSLQDTFIWECFPATTYGSDPNMYVGMYVDSFGCGGAGAERALVQWLVDSLPQGAMISHQVWGGQSESQLWRLPGWDAGGDAITIGTHRMVTPWSGDGATWLNSTGDIAWTQPGAENNYLTTQESAVSVSTGGAEGYISMGPLDSLIGAWHTNQYYTPWGDPNYGVVYKSTSESTPDLDRAFGQFEYGNAPLLSVTYFDDAFFATLIPNADHYMPRAPSPDYFQINNEAGWRAVGIRPLDGRSDYDLFLSPSPSFAFANNVASSVKVGSTPDFIVINPNVSATLYPWIAQWEGTGLYYLRYATPSGTLDLGGTTLINGTAFNYSVLSVYQANLTAGQNYQITLNIPSGDADLGLALIAPTAAGGNSYMSRDEAVAQSDKSTFGGIEEIIYSPSVSGQYGVVVWNNGSTQDSNYILSLQGVSPDLRVHLPIIFRNYVPPLSPLTNGSFETGAFSPWTRGGPGGPMVASVVANPLSSCFSGSYTAMLGTPGQLKNNTIPIGEVNFVQQFHVPPGSSQLIFKYQVFSYDIIKGSSGRLYDRFEVTINNTPVLTDGNPDGSSDGKILWQSGCQTGSLNVSAFAGQNITLKFSVYNLTYPSYNTWAYVDNVQVQ